MDFPENRRQFLGLGAGALSGAMGISIVAAAFPYVVAPLASRRNERETEVEFQDLGPVQSLPIGTWRLIPLELVHEDGWQQRRVRHAVWVRANGPEEREIEVLSSICPHLGCLINWQADQGQFVCPCHGGTFHSSGQCVAGPPPRSMDPLEHQVRNGRLLVRWVDFKTGSPQPTPLGT